VVPETAATTCYLRAYAGLMLEPGAARSVRVAVHYRGGRAVAPGAPAGGTTL
jgi:hypothetical protein